MELEHRFEVPVGLERTWTTLTDPLQIGECFPGASVDKVNGDEFSGAVKVKLGPMSVSYKGDAKIVERDPVAHRARIEALGSAPRAASTAALLVTATASSLAPNRTEVELVTTLSITGRPAKADRGVLIDVGNRLISEFADCLSQSLIGKAAGDIQLVDVTDPDQVAAAVIADERDAVADGEAAGLAPFDPATAGARAAANAPSGRGRIATPAPRSDDEPAPAAVPILERVVPILAALLGILLLRRLFRRSRKRGEPNGSDGAGDDGAGDASVRASGATG